MFFKVVVAGGHLGFRREVEVTRYFSSQSPDRDGPALAATTRLALPDLGGKTLFMVIPPAITWGQSPSYWPLFTPQRLLRPAFWLLAKIGRLDSFRLTLGDYFAYSRAV